MSRNYFSKWKWSKTYY